MGMMRGLLGIAAVGLCAGFGGQALAQDPTPTAAALMQGGQYCFDMSASDRPDTFQHVSLDGPKSEESADGPSRPKSYPGSLMGVIAVVRQTFFDLFKAGLIYRGMGRPQRGA